MKNLAFTVATGTSPESLVKEVVGADTAFILCFYGVDVDPGPLQAAFQKAQIPFIGCMDVGRLVGNHYDLSTTGIAAVAFSKEVIEKVGIGLVNVAENQSREQIRKESYDKITQVAKSLGVNLEDPDMGREFIIDLVYGLNSATPMLEGQTQASMMLQSVGGSSGGKFDFINTNVVSSQGMGKYGAFALIQLKPGYQFEVGRVSSFEEVDTPPLVVDKLENPRHILQINGKPALQAYEEALQGRSQLKGPELYANYTLGVEPGDGERLITSIMKDDGKNGILTYNDVIVGTSFRLFKAKTQKDERQTILKGLKARNLVGYISFDCVLCYLARNSLKEVETIAKVYGEEIGSVPKIGFGTFSENICGANVNQTETYLALFKK